MKITVINGPNINMLGKRETNYYGDKTLEQINSMISELAAVLCVKVDFFQSNSEGEIIDCIHNTDSDGMLINPAAYSHTSIAIRDAISSVTIPAVEVHLSNIFGRDEFRHHSYVAPACIGQISGFGAGSYLLGLRALVEHIKGKKG
ncbi:MAG: type II 3-dehydroquinate dehydratase [Spirochaetes bacterium]|jgi:3-dehydroquinate dehydratase-2|nr:type II 3-dehydroquinate dehydratase [Spirochaetota bacterium]